MALAASSSAPFTESSLMRVSSRLLRFLSTKGSRPSKGTNPTCTDLFDILSRSGKPTTGRSFYFRALGSEAAWKKEREERSSRPKRCSLSSFSVFPNSGMQTLSAVLCIYSPHLCRPLSLAKQLLTFRLFRQQSFSPARRSPRSSANAVPH